MERVSEALRRAGLEPAGQALLIGEGAWHQAWLAELAGGRRVVVRIRKEIIYGQRPAYHEADLLADYAPVGLYYRAANEALPGICPSLYRYGVAPDLSYTVESWMGRPVPLEGWSDQEARAYGASLGAFFRKMHDRPAPPSGAIPGLRVEQEPDLLTGMERLAAAGVVAEALVPRLEAGLAQRSDAARLSLVNRDITPENLLVQDAGRPGLIDPVVLLGRGSRWSAWFLFCYRFLLPGLDEAPRYASRQYGRLAPVLAAVADGFAAGYGEAEALELEYLLWLLEEACDCHALLEAEPTPKQAAQNGSKAAIARRRDGAVAELGRLAARGWA